jgi:hypothetical protein
MKNFSVCMNINHCYITNNSEVQLINNVTLNKYKSNEDNYNNFYCLTFTFRYQFNVMNGSPCLYE